MIRRVSLKTLQGHCTIFDSLEHVPFNGSLSSVIKSKVVCSRSATRLPCHSGLIRCLVRSSRCSRREWYRCKKKGPQIIFLLPSFKPRGTGTSRILWDSELSKREGNWAKLIFAKTSGMSMGTRRSAIGQFFLYFQ